MPVVAAAVCPHPPLIVPEIAAGAAPELDGLRAACAAAIARLRAARPDRVVVVGSESPVGAGFGAGDLPAGLPLAHAVGAWLLGPGPVDFAIVPGSVEVDPDRVALLVMADGSACRGVKSPGYDDPRAAPFDAAVSVALASADPGALLRLDPTLAAELRVAGLAPWQALARAVAADGRDWRGELLYDDAPYGVAYFVAVWAPS